MLRIDQITEKYENVKNVLVFKHKEKQSIVLILDGEMEGYYVIGMGYFGASNEKFKIEFDDLTKYSEEDLENGKDKMGEVLLRLQEKDYEAIEDQAFSFKEEQLQLLYGRMRNYAKKEKLMHEDSGELEPMFGWKADTKATSIKKRKGRTKLKVK